MRPVATRTRTRTVLPPRRGVTLVEMLVAVGLLVLMMAVLVTIFQSATGSITEQRAYAALDQELRRIDQVIRLDLAGVTARMTPPNDPRDGRGYFEYAENALSDAQGEDTDDTLRFTAQAPAGKPFVGRIWVPKSVVPRTAGVSQTLEPITVTSQYAEIIYFLRGTNLYRRVLLIKPTLSGLTGDQLGVTNRPYDINGRLPFDPADSAAFSGGAGAFGFTASVFEPATAFAASNATLGGLPFVGWLAYNDISARPSRFPEVDPANLLVTPQSYAPTPNSLSDLTNRENRFPNPRFSDDYLTIDQSNGNVLFQIPDGIPDDINLDGIPDYYPTLYPGALSATAPQLVFEFDQAGNPLAPPGVPRPAATAAPLDVLAFPYVFPNAYSQAEPAYVANGLGWLHSLDPTGVSYNHAPVDLGDSLPIPAVNLNDNTARQTWWGFPTWRETASPFWLDPFKRINDPVGAPFFNVPPATGQEQPYTQSAGLSWTRRLQVSPMLPPQRNDFDPANPVLAPSTDQPYSEINPYAGSPLFRLPKVVWEDDLLATNVRSFDIKAYDPSPWIWSVANNQFMPAAAGYYDLGYATRNDDGSANATMLQGTPPAFLGTFGHQGRMPPRVADGRADPQYPLANGNPNVGDDSPGVVRMLRTWDSWSTAYTRAPALPLDPTTGPLAGGPPTYPSYPPPYPAPLRGIQIQIRMTDPDNQRVKTLTIRADFNDKL
jgi:type II secretory pathway pseudopilin PulG